MFQIQATFAGETSVVVDEYDTALDALPRACELTNLGYKCEIVESTDPRYLN